MTRVILVKNFRFQPMSDDDIEVNFPQILENYEELKKKEEALIDSVEEKREQQSHIALLLETDYEERLEEAYEQHTQELRNLITRRDVCLRNKIISIFETAEIVDIPTTLKLIYKLKKLIDIGDDEGGIPLIYINSKRKWLNLRCKYLGEDVKKWTSFMRNDFYTLILHCKTIFSDEAVPYLNELVPLYISQYVYTVSQSGLRSLKSAHDYNTLWTLLSLTDNALSQLGCPFLILLIPAIRESFINHITSLFNSTNSIVDCLNEWRHFRAKFLEIPMQMLLKRLSPQDQREFVERAIEAIVTPIS